MRHVLFISCAIIAVTYTEFEILVKRKIEKKECAEDSLIYENLFYNLTHSILENAISY